MSKYLLPVCLVTCPFFPVINTLLSSFVLKFSHRCKGYVRVGVYKVIYMQWGVFIIFRELILFSFPFLPILVFVTFFFIQLLETNAACVVIKETSVLFFSLHLTSPLLLVLLHFIAQYISLRLSSFSTCLSLFDYNNGLSIFLFVISQTSFNIKWRNFCCLFPPLSIN